MEPYDAALGLPTDDVHIVDPRARCVAARILAVVEIHGGDPGLRLTVQADTDDVRRFACAVVIEQDFVPVVRLDVLNRSVLNGVC